MRKLFFFRSSGSDNGHSHHAPPAGNACLKKSYECCERSKRNKKVHTSSLSPKETSSGPKTQQNFVISALRRSHSFSSPLTFSDHERQSTDFSTDASKSPTATRVLNQDHDFSSRGLSETPERPGSCDHLVVCDEDEKTDYCSCSRGHAHHMESSPSHSPVPLKCRAPRVTHISNKVLDLYIDGEQHEVSSRVIDSSGMSSPVSEHDGPMREKWVYPSSGRPPRVQPKGPVSPKNLLKSHSFREIHETYHHHSAELASDKDGPYSPPRLLKSTRGRFAEILPQNPNLISQELESETCINGGDIFEDSELHSGLHLNGFSSRDSLSSDPPCMNGHNTQVTSPVLKSNVFSNDDRKDIRQECSLRKKQEYMDTELLKLGKEVEKRVQILSEGFEEGKVFTRSIIDEMQNLSLQVSTQIKSRVAERISAREAHKIAKLELDARTRRLEKEKNELQSGLEKELDRRSTDWSFKLEKYQSEEQRLRERVRELAEQNVSLQRAVSSFGTRETESQARLTDLEMKLSNATLRTDKLSSENCELNRLVAELQEQSKGAESDRDCILRSHREKEQEIKDLQKSVARLQRINYEQDKTICALQQGLSEEANKSSNKYDGLVKLQREQVRLTSVEQALRKEVENYKHEVDSLKRENTSLLNQFNGGRVSSYMLAEELHTQVNYCQNECFTLLQESGHICDKLLETMKLCLNVGETGSGQELNGLVRCSLVEYDIKLQSFWTDMGNLKRGLRALSAILQEGASLDGLKEQASDCQSLEASDLGHELKAEILLTRALREKLRYQEVEQEKLHADLANSLRVTEMLKSEVQRSHDTESFLKRRVEELQLQVSRKEADANKLENKLEECIKELRTAREILPKMSEERDSLWMEVKQYRETTVVLNDDLHRLKEKIEALEEDVLFKEGQITILKDSLKTNSLEAFDFK